MKALPKRLQWLAVVIFLFGAFYIGTAAVGIEREKRDIEAIRDHFRTEAANIGAAIEEVAGGVSEEGFRELLPSAQFDEDSNEWVVLIPRKYGENPFCTNVLYEERYFSASGGVVRPVGGSGCRSVHSDRFGPGGIRYYFRRAWYSSSKHYVSQPGAEY